MPDKCPKCDGYLYGGWHTNIPGASIGREADDAICLMTGMLREDTADLRSQLATKDEEIESLQRRILAAPGWDEREFEKRYHQWWPQHYWDIALTHPDMAAEVRLEEGVQILEDEMPWFGHGELQDPSRTRASLLAVVAKLRQENARLRERNHSTQQGRVLLQRHRDAWREYAYGNRDKPDDFLDGNKVGRGQTELERLRTANATAKATVLRELERHFAKLQARTPGESERRAWYAARQELHRLAKQAEGEQA